MHNVPELLKSNQRNERKDITNAAATSSLLFQVLKVRTKVATHRKLIFKKLISVLIRRSSCLVICWISVSLSFVFCLLFLSPIQNAESCPTAHTKCRSRQREQERLDTLPDRSNLCRFRRPALEFASSFFLFPRVSSALNIPSNTKILFFSESCPSGSRTPTASLRLSGAEASTILRSTVNSRISF